MDEFPGAAGFIFLAFSHPDILDHDLKRQSFKPFYELINLKTPSATQLRIEAAFRLHRLLTNAYSGYQRFAQCASAF